MQDNSKLPPQTQPSTLDIVLKNNQMNLATAIGRLEQAVKKAYGNINNSINSKQGEFNQALLKTIDQSISQSSNKMNTFFTNSFSKIYALNSVLMEQSLQKNGMVSAQRDLDGYKNYEKLFENQQRAFGDINASLRQIIEKIAPLSENQKMIQNADFIGNRNMEYQDLSAFFQTTEFHNVNRAEAFANADNINKNFFQKRNTKEIQENPMIKALVASDDTALKELQEAKDFKIFWVILIEKLSKAKVEGNKAVMDETHKVFNTDGMFSTATDSNIHRLKIGDSAENNLWSRIEYRAKKAQSIYKQTDENHFLTNNSESLQSEELIQSATRLAFFYLKEDEQNKNKIKDVLYSFLSQVRGSIKDINDVGWEDFVQKQNPFGYGIQQVANTVPGVDKVVSASLDATNFIDRTVDNNYKGIKGANAVGSLETSFINEKRLSKNEFEYTEESKQPIVTPLGSVVWVPKKSLKKRKVDDPLNTVQGVHLPPQKQLLPVKDHVNVNLGASPYNPVKMNTLQENRNLQQNLGFQNLPSVRSSIIVHNHNKFITTINGDNRSPKAMYNDFMSTVNKQISNLTSEAINLYKTGK